MKEKYVTIISILLLFLIVDFFIYKGINLYIYNINNRIITEDKSAFKNGLKIENTLTINKVDIQSDEYLTLSNIKVKNYFKDFKKLEYPESTDKSVKYVLYDENDKVVASFWIGTATFTLTEIFDSKAKDYGIDDKYFLKINRTNILKNNKIENDIDLLQYLIKNKNNKNNIFTSIKEMKNNYAIQYFATTAIFIENSITLIDGDFTGYMFNNNKIKECHILYGGKRYVLTFMGLDYFNESDIIDILSTIVID